MIVLSAVIIFKIIFIPAINRIVAISILPVRYSVVQRSYLEVIIVAREKSETKMWLTGLSFIL